PPGRSTGNPPVAPWRALISGEAPYLSSHGAEQVLAVMDLARENLNEEQQWLGVVLNTTDLRTLHARQALATLQRSFHDKVFRSIIRKSVRYPESAERGVSIVDYHPELATDYVSLADELLAKLGEEDEGRERLGGLRGELGAL